MHENTNTFDCDGSVKVDGVLIVSSNEKINVAEVIASGIPHGKLFNNTTILHFVNDGFGFQIC